jgi:hypothetical protein
MNGRPRRGDAVHRTRIGTGQAHPALMNATGDLHVGTSPTDLPRLWVAGLIVSGALCEHPHAGSGWLQRVAP